MAYKNIVVIAGVPRSGTSWLGQIIDSSPDVAYRFQPLFSYAFKNFVNIDSLKKDYDLFFDEIYRSNDDFLTQIEARDAGLYPTYKDKNTKPSYLAFKICRYHYLLSKMLSYYNNVKLIGIIRHPCGTINSWLKSSKEFPQGANYLKEWRFGNCKNCGREEEFFGFYKWKEVAYLYLDLERKFPSNVYLIKYEDLVNNTVSLSKNIFDFLDLKFTEQTNSFLLNTHAVNKDSAYAVYKDKSVKDSWKQELDSYISSEIFQDIKGTRLEIFL